MVRNAAKHEFWVQWSRSGAFVAKNSDTSLISELEREWHLFGKFCIDFCVVTKQSETPQNMSFGPIGVDWLRSLRKVPTQLCLANLCVNGASSAGFGSNRVDLVRSLRKISTQLHFSELVR
jgi:hypothetical protein